MSVLDQLKPQIDLDSCERIAFHQDTPAHRMLQNVIRECRRLSAVATNMVCDPEYMFAGGRIGRAALLCREATIDKLTEEVKQLKAQLVEAQKPCKRCGDSE